MTDVQGDAAADRPCDAGPRVRATREYIAWVAENARKFEGVELAIEGDTDDELATSLVDGMIRAGLTFEA